MHRGFVKLHRKINDWEWKTKPNTVALFIHLILNANHKDKKWRGKTIKAGQIVTGRKKLSQNTGLSEQQVRTSLNHLKSTNEVTIESTKEYSIISINNWDIFQGPNQQNPNEQPTSNQPITTSKECKEVKECKEKKPPVVPQGGLFEDWYKDYPNKVGRGAAEKAFERAIKKTTLEALKTGLKNYISEKPEDTPWCNPATWLNQERWLDEPATKEINGAPIDPSRKRLSDFNGWEDYQKYLGELTPCR